MRKLLLAMPLLAFLFCFCAGTAWAQKDIFDGLFEKEAPVFHAEIKPASDPGLVELEFYFTHSKMDELEVSFWLKDQGTRLDGGGQKELIGELKTIGNRAREIIRVEDLRDVHFYTFGIDYRNPGALSRKFSSEVLRESYRYRAPETQAAAAAPARPAPEPEPAWRSGPEPARPARPDRNRPEPCINPDLTIKVEPAGYCGDLNRPGVLIQCRNYPDQRWDFAVETRTENGNWQPLRIDGSRQMATGGAVRTEPLCTLSPGVYYLRVLAWGENCNTPVIHTAGPVVVLDPARRGSNDFVVKAPGPAAAPVPQLPDECRAEGEATINGNLISGTVELPVNSPCSGLNPYAQVTYVNPAYRDITLNRFPLTPGRQAPFDIRLDEQDLRRGIHTIQVVVFVREENMREGVAINSFWIRAESADAAFRSEGLSETPYNVPPGPMNTPSPRPEYRPVPVYPEGSTRKGPEFAWNDPPIESSLSEGADTVRVTAADPNCTPVQNLELVFDPNRPDEPLYISWLSPRCCQEDGCEYTVWAGRNPDQLRLLIQGRKPGAVVRELLDGELVSDEYFEVVVKTPNGTRKAAYVLGEGPKYGYEEIIAFRDRRNPPVSDTMTFAQLQPFNYQQPERPVTDYEACKYQRDILITSEGEPEEGDPFTLTYDFSDPGYQYTLFFQPQGSEEWVVAPGTREKQSRPSFTMTATPFHTGRYLVLAAKKNWGCLSAPPAEGKKIVIKTEGEVAR